jgi:ubiquinone/menaquinone biosynthesis C-methylase UbiE
MTDTHRNYIPALRFGWLTPLYDPLVRWTMREAAFKPRLVEQAHIQPGHRVLDLGCGTATLTILAKRAQPDAEIVGLDGDQRILDIARAKVAKAGLAIALDRGMAYDLPYPDNSFDRVLCSLVIHHLTRENKLRALREVLRVLKPGGELHVADFGKPHNALMSASSLLIRHFEQVADHISGLLPSFFREAGFVQVEETIRFMTICGTLSLYRGWKPDSGVRSRGRT